MKNKVAKVSAVSLITLSMTVGNISTIYGINEEQLNNKNEKISTDEDNEKSYINKIDSSTQEEIEFSTSSNDKTSDSSKVIGKNNFIDENGNIKTVEVYDGTTGEVYNPLVKTVITSNMVNFNFSNAGTTTRFTDYYTRQDGYLSKASAADAAFLGYENGKVKFMISGVVGLVDANLVEIVPQGKYYASNYEVNSKGLLYHYISNNVNATQNQGNYNYVGVSPSYLVKGIEYYSYDGHYFYTDYNVMINDYKKNVRTNSVNPNNPYYNYFQYLPLRSKTNYTGTQLTNYLNKKANSSISKLNNTGDIFIKYQDVYGVNALLAASFAALESGWGKSSIAQSKNNLFGLNAVDSNPGLAADAYESVDACIKDFTSNWMSKRYLNATYTSRFRGGYFGDKGSGIFGQYSSDPYEGEKCASIAENMDAEITGKDKNYYTIGIKDVGITSYTTLNFRNASSTSAKVLYTTIKNPAYAFIIRKKEPFNDFYEIQSDSVLTADRTSVSSASEYSYQNNYGYASSKYITIVNNGNDIDLQDEFLEISDVSVSNVTRDGYTVTCTIKSDTEITKLEMPTWTEKNGQDDLLWHTAKVTSQGNGLYKATYTVQTASHNKEIGLYNTHIYVYNAAGKQAFYELPKINVPKNKKPLITNVKITDVTAEGYTVSCQITDDDKVVKVEMPTWTEKNGQDDIVWYKPEQNGNIYTLKVKTRNHNKEGGLYNTHIYAYDSDGEYSVETLEIKNVPEAGKLKIWQ